MGQYSSSGGYGGYNKNNKERDSLDYYATPPQEVTNILNLLKLPLNNATILEPSCGGGHMVKGIRDYSQSATIIASDIKYREKNFILDNKGRTTYYFGEDYDFLSNGYPFDSVDYIIMNPPFSSVIPFVKHSLDIAEKGVLMFGRLEFLETQKRYEEILKDNPPTKIFVYVDRVACYKNGDFTIKPNSIQSYAWFYWDRSSSTLPAIDWIRRVDKNY